MPDIIISAHGGRWSDQGNTLRVPQGSAVVYYVKDGGTLSNNDGYSILANLQRGTVPGGTVVERVAAGAYTYDYSCWYAPEFATHCGIFQVGSSAQLASLQSYTENNPLLLSRIFATYPNATIYWVCCREVAVRGASEALLHSTESFLTQPPTSEGITAITNIQVKSAVGTLFLTGTQGSFDKDQAQLWIDQQGSQTSNGGPIEHTTYTITFTGAGSPQTLQFRGRFAGVGYEFVSGAHL